MVTQHASSSLCELGGFVVIDVNGNRAAPKCRPVSLMGVGLVETKGRLKQAVLFQHLFVLVTFTTRCFQVKDQVFHVESQLRESFLN